MTPDASIASLSFFETGEYSKFNRKLAFLFICVGVAINFTGLFDTIFSGDSALYAAISKSFVSSGNFLDIYVDGRDWLDKPHFPFWLAAISMKIFGVSGSSYKLPSLILFVVGLVYTYKLTDRLYDRDVALLAVLILTYSLHIFISNNDVRAESILIGLITGGVYHFYRAASGSGIWHVVAGSAFCAAAIMTKGPFVVIVFASAVIGYLIGKRDLRGLISWKGLLAGVLTFIFILPEMAALYMQFDMHPEKDILGATNVSGIKYFVWDTQFGRFFNTGPFKGSGSPAFYLHTLLWAFAPWALIAYFMLGRRLANLFHGRRPKEYLTFAGFAMMFVVFSASKFQLPYYTNILFPFLAIICAEGLLTGLPSSPLAKRLMWGASLFVIALVLPVIGGMEFAFNGNWLLVPTLIGALLAGVNALIFRCEKQASFRAVYCLATFIGSFALYANGVFYPHLLRYQAGSEAAFFSNENFPGVGIAYSKYDNLMEFYAKSQTRPVATAMDAVLMPGAGEQLFFVDDAFLVDLQQHEIAYTVIERFSDYRITRLTMEFIDPARRDGAVTMKYLIRIASGNQTVLPDKL